MDILYSQFHHHPLDDVTAVMDGAAIRELQEAVRAVRVDPRIAHYIVDLAEATRRHGFLKMGCSPRGTLLLFRTTQAHAFLSGAITPYPKT